MNDQKRNETVGEYNPSAREKRYDKPVHVDYLKIATMAGSVIAFLFSVYAFLQGQEIIDKRKYNNAFFDERYRVLKGITESISEVDNLIRFNNGDFNLEEKEKLTAKLSVFKYANLVMDRAKKDSVVLNYLGEYEWQLIRLLQSSKNKIEPAVLSRLGDTIIIQCGKILNNEKDSINSVHFKFNPFG